MVSWIGIKKGRRYRKVDRYIPALLRFLRWWVDDDDDDGMVGEKEMVGDVLLLSVSV